MTTTHRLRSWFLRGVLEALERQYGSTALALLTEKVPRRLLPHASLDRLKASAALDTILLDDGEELLLFIDSLLGEGNGRVLEAVGHELAGRALNQGGVAKFGDLHGTVARLQAFLDHPFVDTPTLFELKRTDLGFALTVGVVGRPRATRVLRHLAVGAVIAAERSARGSTSDLKLGSEILADRATLTAQYQRSEPPQRGEPCVLAQVVEPALAAARRSSAFWPRTRVRSRTRRVPRPCPARIAARSRPSNAPPRCNRSRHAHLLPMARSSASPCRPSSSAARAE